MANVIYRGPIDRNESKVFQVEGIADDAFLPGAIVKKTSTGLALSDVAATVFGEPLLIAKELGLNYPDGGIEDTYSTGDAARAYRAEPILIFQARVATGQALVKGVTKLSRNGSGQLKVAVADGTEQVVAIAEATITTSANNTLVDVRAL